jgi:hypothetical protein
MIWKYEAIIMLQRSPSYITSVPVEDRSERMLRPVAPRNLATISFVRMDTVLAV